MPKIQLQPASMRVPPAPYVPGTKRGPFVFTAGQGSVDKDNKGVGEGRKTTVYRTNIKTFAAMNEVYAEVFGQDKPGRTTVEAKLASPKFLVEIEAIAVTKD